MDMMLTSTCGRMWCRAKNVLGNVTQYCNLFQCICPHPLCMPSCSLQRLRWSMGGTHRLLYYDTFTHEVTSCFLSITTSHQPEPLEQYWAALQIHLLTRVLHAVQLSVFVHIFFLLSCFGWLPSFVSVCYHWPVLGSLFPLLPVNYWTWDQLKIKGISSAFDGAVICKFLISNFLLVAAVRSDIRVFVCEFFSCLNPIIYSCY